MLYHWIQNSVEVWVVFFVMSKYELVYLSGSGAIRDRYNCDFCHNGNVTNYLCRVKNVNSARAIFHGEGIISHSNMRVGNLSSLCNEIQD